MLTGTGDTIPPHLPEPTMKPLARHHVNKHRSARKFRKQTSYTKAANMNGPMRGGIRL